MHKRYNFKTVADVGYGLGFFTNRIYREVLGVASAIHGFDISHSAVQKAQNNFPDLKFSQFDITQSPQLPKSKFDLVISKESHWYVLKKLVAFRTSISKLSRQWIYVVQSFQRMLATWARNFPNPNSIIKFWEAICNTEYVCIETDSKFNNRPLIHLFLRKREL